MTLGELCNKDVIDIKTGTNYGRADDLQFSASHAVIEKMILHGRPKLFGLLGKDKDVLIDWSKIITIGEDAVLVDLPMGENEIQKAVHLKAK